MSSILSYVPSHKNGFTSVCICDDGKLITGGHDGKVLIWNHYTDKSPEEHIVSDRINSVVQWGNYFINATGSTMVQMYSIEDGLPEGIATRFTAEVNHLALNKEKTKLAAGGSDFVVKLINLSANEDCGERKEYSFTGHCGPVLSVALDPLDIYMASSSCDGSVKIWSIESSSLELNKTPIKNWNILAKYNDLPLAESRSRLTWEPLEGKILAVATEKEIRLIERTSWDVLRFLNSHLISQPILDIAFSSDGVYLAAGSKDGWLIVWKVDDGDVVSKFKHHKCHSICSLTWLPTANQTIVFADLSGYIGVVKIVLKLTQPQEPKAFSGDDALTAEDIVALMGDDEDDDELLNSAAQQKSEADKEKVIDDDNDDANSVDISKLKASFMVESDVSLDSYGKRNTETNKGSAALAPVKLPPPHKPCQSGAAPIGLSERIMVWNRIGVVIQYDNEDDQSVEVEFHDTTFHHHIHINNSHNYVLADLNEHALVLCSQGDSDDDDETESRSQLYVQSLQTVNQEWRISMPSGESIIGCCAVGQNHVAVVTSASLLRVFTLMTGIQTGIVSLPGSPISLCGYGNSLMIVCQQGMVGPLLHYSIIPLTLQKASTRQSQWSALPLSKSTSNLVWCGFSEYGTPFTVDSEGVVRCLARQWNSAVWSPVQQLKHLVKENSDCYFVVGVMESTGKLHALYCKANTYPHTLPRPSVELIDFRVPACIQENDKEGLEEEYLRVKLVSNMNRYLSEETDQEILQTMEEEASNFDNRHKAVLLKMFALALKLDQEVRCMEIAELMPDAAAVQLAIRYAAKLRRNQLCERLGELALRKEQEALQDDQSIEDEYYPDNKTTNRLSPPKTIRRFSDPHSESSQPVVSTHNNNGVGCSESEDEREEILGRESDENSRDFESQENSAKQTHTTTTTTTLPRNPFKKLNDSSSLNVSTLDKSGSVTGSQVFDNLSKNSLSLKSTQSVSSQLSSSKSSNRSQNSKKQSTLFGDRQSENIPPKTKKSKETQSNSKLPKFNEWFEYRRSELEDEFPEKSVEELLELAKERFESECKGKNQNQFIRSNLLDNP